MFDSPAVPHDTLGTRSGLDKREGTTLEALKRRRENLRRESECLDRIIAQLDAMPELVEVFEAFQQYSCGLY